MSAGKRGGAALTSLASKQINRQQLLAKTIRIIFPPQGLMILQSPEKSLAPHQCLFWSNLPSSIPTARCHGWRRYRRFLIPYFCNSRIRCWLRCRFDWDRYAGLIGLKLSRFRTNGSTTRRNGHGRHLGQRSKGPSESIPPKVVLMILTPFLRAG